MPAKRKPKRAPGPGSDTVSALSRGLTLLRCFEQGGGTLGNRELALRTGIPKATVSRLATTLVSHDWLRQAVDTGRYSLSPHVMRLAGAFLADLDVRARALPRMAELAEATGAGVHLALPDGTDMVVVETARSRQALVIMRIDVGTRLAIAHSAIGRAWLCGLDTVSRASALRRLAAVEGNRWPALRRRLDRATLEYATHGYCTSIGEWHADINAVAVALRGPTGECLALNCGGAAFALPEDRIRNTVAPLLLDAAREIARDIGGDIPVTNPTPRKESWPI